MVQVSRWRVRYAQARLAGIVRDLPRGAPPETMDAARLVELTTQTQPEAATHWSTRTMAAQLGVRASSVSRHWRANGLKPHLVRGFEVSRDPQFVEKLEDVVGPYMSPPEHSLLPKDKTLHLIVPVGMQIDRDCGARHPGRDQDERAQDNTDAQGPLVRVSMLSRCAALSGVNTERLPAVRPCASRAIKRSHD